MNDKNNTLLGNGFVWVSTSVISAVLPTALAYLFERISQETVPDIKKYFDSILLIVFSISCSLFAICLDIRSKSINNIFREIILILSFFMAFVFGAYHFYIIGKDNFVIQDPVLIITIGIALLFSILGLIISHHHNNYESTIRIFYENEMKPKNKTKTIPQQSTKKSKKNKRKN